VFKEFTQLRVEIVQKIPKNIRKKRSEKSRHSWIQGTVGVRQLIEQDNIRRGGSIEFERLLVKL
jgi:hypothetical protein